MTIPRLVLAAALIALSGLTACSSRCPHMSNLYPMLGKHRFEGYRARGRKGEIGGTITVGLTPERLSLLLHYTQNRPEAEHGFGEIHWDPKIVAYVLTWEASGQPGGPMAATGFVHADGRLIFENDVRALAPASGENRRPTRFIYTFTFPEDGKFILTIRHPGPGPDKVYESFRITADRTASEPSRREFRRDWIRGRDRVRTTK